MPEEKDFPLLETVSFGSGDFVPVFQRVGHVASATEAGASETGKEDSDASERTSSDCSLSEGPTEVSTQKIFSCPEEGCTKSFVRYSSMERHCEYGVHVRVLEKVTLQDRAKLSYARRLEEGQTKPLPSVIVTGSPHCFLLDKGWGLKSKAKAVRFSEKQKTFIEGKFLQGEKSGKKVSGEAVAKEMRKVKDANNQRLFSLEEFLTPQQITSYFSRFAAKRKQLSESECEAAEAERALQEAKQDIITSLEEDFSIKHPIVHKDLQLCAMSDEQLSMLRMATLRAICKEFDLNASGRRKEPYIKCVVSLVSGCTCKAST